MDIAIDLSSFYQFLSLPADQLLLAVFLTVGWIPIAIIFLWGAKEIWIDYVQNQWAATQKFIMLAIDVPRGNTQSLKAVENIFTYLAGAHGTKNLVEKYWEGQFQLSFSLEIVSIDGYTQFLVRSPIAFRNLVESAIYSQYPDAEISEVDDYTTGMPTRYPDPEYDLWGTEFSLTAPSAYPIKTYPGFLATDGTKPEEQFKDPMASLMDLCSSLKKGEQLWHQIIIVPTGFEWTKKSEAEIKKVLGEKAPAKDNFVDILAKMFIGALSALGDIFYTGEAAKKEEKKDEAMKMMNLKPKEKKQIEAIQMKSSKIGFDTKIRFIYISKKDSMVKPKVVNGFNGYLKQFAEQDLNGLKPDSLTVTSAGYIYKDLRMNSRKGKVIRNYMSRSASSGRSPGLLNVEELATLWHFPLELVVKAPMIQKAPGRKSEPPMSLPLLEDVVGDSLFAEAEGKDSIFRQVDNEAMRWEAPVIKTDTVKKGGVVDISNLGFESIFEVNEPEFLETLPKFEENKIEKIQTKPVADKGKPPSNLPFG